MISNEMLNLGKKRSIIRDIFEYGATRKKEIGAENVYDFSLGNPSIPAPDCVNEAIKELLEKEILYVCTATHQRKEILMLEKQFQILLIINILQT